jgi:large subunit ribosomal protein L19
MSVLEDIQKEQMRVDLPDFRTGDRVRVHAKIREGGKERVQAFEGAVLRKRNGKVNASFTVRKVSYGVGVERTFPLHSPMVEFVEVIQRGKVRQSRIYYLRKRHGKAARIQERRD